MNCHRLSSLLSAYIDGELSGVEMIEIRHHLDGCPSCQDELTHLRDIKRLVGRLRTAQPSPYLDSHIYASLDRVQPYSLLKSWSSFWQSTFQRFTPAAAAVAIVFFAIFMLTAGGIDEKLKAEPNFAVAVNVPSISTPPGFYLTDQSDAPTIVSTNALDAAASAEMSNRGWTVTSAAFYGR